MKVHRHAAPAGLRRLVVAIAIPLVLVGPAAAPAQGAGPRVTAFYALTQAAYNAWNGGAAPTRATTFPAGTTNIGYYVDYSSATPGTTHIQVFLRDPSGAVSKGDPHALHHVDGAFADEFSDDPAFAPGTYTFGLLLGGKLVASAHFKVLPGLAVPTFYTGTKKAIEAWQNASSAPNPARTTRFPSGTSAVGYYLSFVGATPGATSFRCTVYDAAGHIAAQGDAHTLHHVSGYFGNYFYNTPSFPDGHYQVTLRMKGLPPRSIAFTVGG